MIRMREIKVGLQEEETSGIKIKSVKNYTLRQRKLKILRLSKNH